MDQLIDLQENVFSGDVMLAEQFCTSYGMT
jgi:hypothetical protein